jgi:hypothetical protein
MRCTPCLFATVVALLGCDDSTACTRELRFPIQVDVSSPDGLPIDSVTATREREDECADLSYPGLADGGDASSSGHYACTEQGGGTYVVRVTSGELTWSKSTHIDADECHTTEDKSLTFVLDPETAD